jgi:hypothetical protein
MLSSRYWLISERAEEGMRIDRKKEIHVRNDCLSEDDSDGPDLFFSRIRVWHSSHSFCFLLTQYTRTYKREGETISCSHSSLCWTVSHSKSTSLDRLILSWTTSDVFLWYLLHYHWKSRNAVAGNVKHVVSPAHVVSNIFIIDKESVSSLLPNLVPSNNTNQTQYKERSSSWDETREWYPSLFAFLLSLSRWSNMTWSIMQHSFYSNLKQRQQCQSTNLLLAFSIITVSQTLLCNDMDNNVVNFNKSLSLTSYSFVRKQLQDKMKWLQCSER